MAEQLTELILRRIELAKTVGAGIDTFLDEAVAGYEQYLAPVVAEGETPVDVRQHLVLLRRKNDAYLESLQGLDMGVLNQTSGTDFLRVELGFLTGEVIGKIRRVTDITRGIYGPEVLSSVALDGGITRVPLRVYDRGRRVQAIFRSPNLKLRPLAGFVLGADGETNAFSPLALADHLEPQLTDLGLLVDERFGDNREETIARLRRQRAVKEFDQGMRGIVRMVQGMLLAAGRPDLAKRFRLRFRRTVPQQVQGPLADSEQAESPLTDSEQAESQQAESQQAEGQPVDASASTP